MAIINEERTLPESMADQICRAWCAYKNGQASEIDLILLWLDAAAQSEGAELHPGWTIAPNELLRDVEVALGACADEQELERRGLGWLSGALEGPKRRNLIGTDSEEIKVVDRVDNVLRGAKARVSPNHWRRRFRPVA